MGITKNDIPWENRFQYSCQNAWGLDGGPRQFELLCHCEIKHLLSLFTTKRWTAKGSFTSEIEVQRLSVCVHVYV